MYLQKKLTDNVYHLFPYNICSCNAILHVATKIALCRHSQNFDKVSETWWFWLNNETTNITPGGAKGFILGSPRMNPVYIQYISVSRRQGCLMLLLVLLACCGSRVITFITNWRGLFYSYSWSWWIDWGWMETLCRQSLESRNIVVVGAQRLIDIRACLFIDITLRDCNIKRQHKSV